jgi:hypothetical protein
MPRQRHHAVYQLDQTRLENLLRGWALSWPVATGRIGSFCGIVKAKGAPRRCPPDNAGPVSAPHESWIAAASQRRSVIADRFDRACANSTPARAVVMLIAVIAACAPRARIAGDRRCRAIMFLNRCSGEMRKGVLRRKRRYHRTVGTRFAVMRWNAIARDALRRRRPVPSVTG